MARIQQSVEIRVPAHVAYNQLTQFEHYPRFMQEVESAQQVDDTHVRWTTRIGQHTHDWHSEIIEQQPDHCIAWRNTDGPVDSGRVDVEALGDDDTRVTFTLEAQAASAGTEAEQAMARQVQQDLQRLKQWMETQGHETGAWRGEVQDGQVTGNESGTATASVATATSALSENSLSQHADRNREDSRFNVAEEVNLDQQSDAVRQAGNLPHQSSEGYGDMGAAEAMKDALQGDQKQEINKNKDKLGDSIARAVPPSD